MAAIASLAILSALLLVTPSASTPDAFQPARPFPGPPPILLPGPPGPPCPSPGPPPCPCPLPECLDADCTCVDKKGDDLLSIIFALLGLLLNFILGLVFFILSLVVNLLGPTNDCTSLLGALGGIKSLEGFLGSLPIVLKYLNLINVPTALLG